MSSAHWEATTQELYGKVVVTTRLVARWPAPADRASLPPVIERMRELLAQRYERPFDSVSANLYRDGRDSVAWHGDRIGRGNTHDTMVAIVSVGDPRALHLRPRGGGESITVELGHGDLLVMGGTCQRTWEHAVPKVAQSGPRMSVQFRPFGVF